MKERRQSKEVKELAYWRKTTHKGVNVVVEASQIK
jgi:hypothetical protein